VKRQAGIVEYKYRVNWSQVEFRHHIDDIEHPIVRETLKYLEIDEPLEITTMADIPAKTGLGSSSAFTVGLLNALFALKGKYVTKYKIASEAAHIEVDILGRKIGKQDHFAAAYGGLNVFTFNPDESVAVDPVFHAKTVWEKLESCLLLFFTGMKRDASKILEEQNLSEPNKRQLIQRLKDFVPEIREVLCQSDDIGELGRILHESWEIKRSLSDSVSTQEIDKYYLTGLRAGATGGKVLGAGGGGFLLFFAPESKHASIKRALGDLYCLDFRLDSAGTRITYYDESGSSN